MPSEISGSKMSINFRNISSDQTGATSRGNSDRTPQETQGQAVSNTAKSTASDQVVLSSKAQEVRSLIAELAQPPQSNSQRIEALKTAINSGNYSVSADKIASKMLTIDFGYRNQEE